MRFKELRFNKPVKSPHRADDEMFPRFGGVEAAAIDVAIEHGFCKLKGKVREVWTAVANVNNALPEDAPVIADRKGSK